MEEKNKRSRMMDTRLIKVYRQVMDTLNRLYLKALGCDDSWLWCIQ